VVSLWGRPSPRLSAGVLTADLIRLGDELAILRDLLLVLAIDPGWPGQPPAANTPRRVAAVRDLAASLGRPAILIACSPGWA
jgi:hypothetical protein